MNFLKLLILSSLAFSKEASFFAQFDKMQGSALGVHNGDWTKILILVLAGMATKAFFRLVGPTLGKPFHKILLPRDKSKHKTVLSKSLSTTLMAAFWMIALHYASFPETLETTLFVASKTVFTLGLIWFLWRTADYISETLQHRAALTETKFDDILVPFIKTGLRISVLIIGIVLGAEILQLPLQNLVAGLGIGSLAFALAAKDTIENLFGSITVLLDRPFQIGDWVVIGKVEGTVEQLGFRSTKIKTFYDSQITLPNSTLIKATVDNMGVRTFRRIKTTLGITYNTPADAVDSFCQGIRELIKTHPYTRKDYSQVYLNQFGASSLDILLYCFVEVPDWSTELRERERLFLDIMRLAQSLDIQFAYPTQTLFVNPEINNPLDTNYEEVEQISRNLSQSHFQNGQRPKPV